MRPVRDQEPARLDLPDWRAARIPAPTRVVGRRVRLEPLSAAAHWVLPGAAFAEKDGTFVNHAGLAQAIRWGVTPTGEIRTDGQTFLDLLGRSGLAHAATLRKELATEIAYFRSLVAGDPGEYGISLESAKGA